LPELRKDPIVGRWVIISTDRAKRPTDFTRDSVKMKGGFCPFCYGNESKTPPEIQAYRPNQNGGPPAQRDTPGWTVRVVPGLSFLRLALRAISIAAEACSTR
jgi:UDPglucose--hexose-1-phosphate uridylyltransferase